jgi:hypothetical protein
MPDLSKQIETLYRVIGQIRPNYESKHEFGLEPGSVSGNRRDAQLERPILRQAAQQGAFRVHQGSARPAGRAVSIRWTFKFYCFWFSLPLSVWFTSGWIGLFFYWRALSGAARLLDLFSRIALFSRLAPFSRMARSTRAPSFVLGKSMPRKLAKPCSAIEWEAQ